MIWTIFVILLVLWLVGMVSSVTFGGFIHLLLVIALVMLVINLVSGRRPCSLVWLSWRRRVNDPLSHTLPHEFTFV